MKRRGIHLGDIFALNGDTCLATYIGKYGLTARSLTLTPNSLPRLTCCTLAIFLLLLPVTVFAYVL